METPEQQQEEDITYVYPPNTDWRLFYYANVLGTKLRHA